MPFSLLARETVWAARRLSRAPGFVAVAVLTLAVAIAPSLIFRLVDQAVLPPLPFARSQDLLSMWQRVSFGRMATSYPKLRFLREHSHTMDVSFHTGGVVFLERGGASVRLSVSAVTPNFFAVLGAAPSLGRVFGEDENVQVLSHPVVVLSDRLWRTRFGAAKEVVGQQVVLNGRTFTVLGVMPRGFRESWWEWTGLSGSDAWIPAMMAPIGMSPNAEAWRDTPLAIEATHANLWLGVGRLRADHSLREARAEAAVLGREVTHLWPPPPGVVAPFDIVPLSQEAVDPSILHAVSLLKVAGSLILLLGALNTGHLFLARGLARAQTLGLHNVLGAPRFALVGGAVCEAVLVGAAGALLAILLTRGALAALAVAEPTLLTAPFGVTFDPSAWRVDGSLAATALALAGVAALFFGLAPAWKTTRLDATSFLRVGSSVRAGGLRQLRLRRPRGLLVAVETALALALTLPALLLVQTLGHLVQADLGFRPQQVATAELRLPTGPDAVAFVDETTRRVAQAPGVASASWVSCLPIDCAFYTSAVKAAGARASAMVASVQVVAPDAFRTLGIPLRTGRDFGADDRPGTAPVVILSEQAARRLGGASPGSRIEVPVIGSEALEVAGVVADVPYRDLAAEPMPAIYLPLAQRPMTEGVLVARGITGDTAALADAMRVAVASQNPRLEPLVVSALATRVEQNVARFRGAAWLLGVAAALALFLSAVGVYGLLSSLVAQSRPEMAIRLALGATPGALARSLATATLRLALVGLVVGAALGSWGATYLRSYLYGVSPWELQALASSVVVAIALASLAALRPSYRASRADPLATLRCE